MSSAGGATVAQLLSGAWRPSPSPPKVSWSSLEPRLAFLVAGAVGPLVARRLALGSDPPVAAALEPLLARSRLQHRMRQAQLVRLAQALGEGGIRYLLGKGWLAAQAYALPELRSFTDLDLFVAPLQVEAAQRIADATGVGILDVDLHAGCPLLDAPFGMLLERAGRLRVGPTEVPVLAPEDHVCLLAAHGFKHGFVRPLWLCDVAARLEAEPALDWEALYRRGLVGSYLQICVALAQRLLGAERPDLRPLRSPRWAERTLLAEWSLERPREPVSLRAALRGQANFRWALRTRWPNGFTARQMLQLPADGRPRPLAPALAYLRREAQVAARLLLVGRARPK